MNEEIKDYGTRRCPVCGRYEDEKGFKYIHAYQICVCSRCYRGNVNGWSLEYELVLIEHMKRLGLSLPPRNENGWLPRDVYEVVKIIK